MSDDSGESYAICRRETCQTRFKTRMSDAALENLSTSIELTCPKCQSKWSYTREEIS